MSDAILGFAVWGLILFFVVRLVMKRMKGNRANATSNAEAIAEGGDATSAANSGVTIQFHVHIGDGISVSRSDNGDPIASYSLPISADQLRGLDGNVAPLAVSDGSGDFGHEGGDSVRTLPVSISARSARRNHNLALGE